MTKPTGNNTYNSGFVSEPKEKFLLLFQLDFIARKSYRISQPEIIAEPLAIIMSLNWKHKILFSIFGLFLISTYGQKEKPEFDFDMDAVSAEFRNKLSKQKVDTLLRAYYFFDNGRGNNATNLFFWTKDGKNYIKAIGLGKKEKANVYETTDCPEFKEILDFYFNNTKEIIGSEPKPSMFLSHNYGFHVLLKINGTEFKTYLRNESWMENEHPRAKWIQMIAEIAKPYIRKK